MKKTYSGNTAYSLSKKFKTKNFRDIAPLKKLMYAHVHDTTRGMKATNDDKVLVITGHTGSGKSYLALELYEHYYKTIYPLKITKRIFKTFAIRDKDWIEAIVEFKNDPFMMIAHDEAINILYNRDSITAKNKIINKLFKQIRGKRFYYLMLIPQVHRLDREFRDDRIVGLINVYKKNGIRYAAYYSTKRCDLVLNELDQLMKNRASKAERTDILNTSTPPNFVCRIPEYKGALLGEYKTKKEGNMDTSIDDAANTILGVRGKQNQMGIQLGYQLIKKVEMEGMTVKEAAKDLNIHYMTAYKYMKYARNNEENLES